MSVQTAPSLDITHFHAKAIAYVRAKGWADPDAEDLVSEMLVRALEQPETALAIELVYLQARDALDPRSRHDGGTRMRVSQRTRSLDACLPGTAEARRPTAPDTQSLLEQVPATGPLRAMLLLCGLHGYSQQEVGILFGVTESRISHLFRAYREETQLAALRPALPDESSFPLVGLELEWLWL
jgi:DNA-directed RNA polymerase specialized sigma24 family protein